MQKATLLCIATAVAIAGASTTAAAERNISKERQATVARIKDNLRNFQQPKTMAEAERTAVSSPTKGVGMLVATELQATLVVQKDAQGNMKIVEVEGNEMAAPAAEVVADE